MPSCRNPNPPTDNPSTDVVDCPQPAPMAAAVSVAGHQEPTLWVGDNVEPPPPLTQQVPYAPPCELEPQTMVPPRPPLTQQECGAPPWTPGNPTLAPAVGGTYTQPGGWPQPPHAPTAPMAEWGFSPAGVWGQWTYCPGPPGLQ